MLHEETRREMAPASMSKVQYTCFMVNLHLGSLGCSLSIIYIYIYQGSDKGGGVVQRLLVGTKRNAYGAQLQNSVHGPFFCSYKIQNTTFSDSENNSKSVLQNPMHLKLTNS